MRIAVDAMGGDYAPSEIVAGAMQAALEDGTEIMLVGDTEVLEKELSRWPQARPGIHLVHAGEVIGMDDQPALALRRKKNSSIGVATSLVRDGEADALVSAGSTGAQMAAALLTLGRVSGIARPAIATILPAVGGPVILLDVGANMDCRPQHLLQFAHMGSIYAEKIMAIENPRVGLLNVGMEVTKGNELTLVAYRLLQNADLNFTGNIEPRDIPVAKADVVVCDGFVGNSIIKFGEGLASAAFDMLSGEIHKHVLARLGAALMLPTLRSLAKKFDYSEYGGAPLLGVNGVSIVCHGSSKAQAIRNAIRVAGQCVENGFVLQLQQAFASQGGVKS